MAPTSRSRPAPTYPGLFWASDDGFGVRGGELDEINFPETLTVGFYTPRTVTGVWFTDLFQAPDGGPDGEEAMIELYSGGILLATFMGVGFGGEEPLGTNNDGKFGDFKGSFLVDKVIFRSVYEKNDEYSVAGFVTPVPVPVALGMVIYALAGLGLIGWRRNRAAV